MVLEYITDRYSARNFADKTVPDEVLHNILEAGRLAPSWLNVQPWKFIVIKDQDTKDLLSKLSHGQRHVAMAPVIIACCGDYSAWDYENFKQILESRPGMPEEKINVLLNHPTYNPKLKGHDAVVYRTIEQLTYAVAYMTLEAWSHGVGSCIIGAIGNELTESVPDIYSQVRQRLNLPQNMVLVNMLILGYPAPESRAPEKVRRPLEDIVSYEKYTG